MRPQAHSRSSITGAHLLAPGRDIALGAHLATRMPLDEHPRAFANIGEVHAAFDLGEVTWRSPALWRIGGNRHKTTVGRILFFKTFPECLPFERANRPVCAADLRNLIDEVELLAGCEEATAFARRLCVWSLDTATRHGFSLGLGDVAPLPERGPETAGAQASIVETRESFKRGDITDGERHNRLIDAWTNVEFNLRASLPKSIARNYPALTAALAAGDAPLMFKKDGISVPGSYLEVVVSQMLAWVRVIDPGGSDFQPGEIVHRESFAQANRCLRDRCTEEATADFAMLGLNEIPQRVGAFRSLLLGHAPRWAAKAALFGAVDSLMGSLERAAVGALPRGDAERDSSNR